MQRPEQEESEGGSRVDETDVVPGAVQQEPHQQAADHPYVLVHAEGQEVPLAQGGGNVHQVAGQADEQDLQHKGSGSAATSGGQHFRAEPLLKTQHITNHQDVGDKGHEGDVQVCSIQFELWLDRLVLIVADGPAGVVVNISYFVEP